MTTILTYCTLHAEVQCKRCTVYIQHNLKFCLLKIHSLPTTEVFQTKEKDVTDRILL